MRLIPDCPAINLYGCPPARTVRRVPARCKAIREHSNAPRHYTTEERKRSSATRSYCLMAKYQHRIGRTRIPMEPTISYMGDKIFVGDVVATTSNGMDNNSSAIPSYCPMAKYQHRIGRHLIPIGPTLRKAPLVHQRRSLMANDITLRIAILQGGTNSRLREIWIGNRKG